MSFKEQNITPELAQKIGMEFANEVWGKRFQVVVTTHLNTKHLHCHYVINSVSFKDGKRCQDTSWFKFRKVADRICEKYGLYYNPNPNRSKQSSYYYKQEQAGMPTRYSMVREAIDEAIAHSTNIRSLDYALTQMGFVRNQIGSQFIMSIKKTDIKRYYNSLVDERHLKPATIDSIHTVLHQVFEMAVDDDYIRSNPTDNVLRELKKSHCFKTEKRRALTKPEQELFLNYLKNTPEAQYWYPIFAVMVGTGLRVGELTGLRWCDIDLEESIIDVNHTLVYYDHRTEGSKKGCYFNVNTTKTPAGIRQVPMLEFVKEAFLMEKERQELLGLHCEATVDGYTDFIFVNRFGQPQHQATLNKAIRRIIRNCNDKQFLESENPEVLLPHFSCHSLRHSSLFLSDFPKAICSARGVENEYCHDRLGNETVKYIVVS